MPGAVSRALTLQELLAVEDDAALLEFRCPQTDVPLWSAIRNPFMRFLMSDLVISTELATEHRGVNFRSDRTGAAFAVAKAIGHNIRVRSSTSGPILITTGSAGLQLRKDRWFNRLSDPFASEAPLESVVLEDLFKWRFRAPRFSPQVLFHTTQYLQGQLAGRMRAGASHRKAADATVRLVRARAKQLLDWDMSDSRFTFLTGLLAREAAAMPVMNRIYRKLFARLGTRIILKEMGCYGRSAVFNATARDMGLTVAEHQHGLVSAGHDAYNFAPAILASDAYRRSLPQYFLSYGDWWGEQINAPLERITIGNPHRTEQLRTPSASAADRQDILVLGDGFRTDFYLEFARALAGRAKRPLRVVFRPHPLERARLQQAHPRGLGSVCLDQNADLYESFGSAYAVVSEASTGLFEAVGQVDRIFVLQTQRGLFSLPRHPFECCTDAGDLADQLAEPSIGPAGVADIRRIWAPGWQDNYRAFLSGRRRIEPASQAV